MTRFTVKFHRNEPWDSEHNRKLIAEMPALDRPDNDKLAAEKKTRAVPLSHGDLIANVRASTKALQCTRRDRMLSVLPPFHSFGLMGTLIAPMITGVRMVHYPDPKHAAGRVRTVAACQPTLTAAVTKERRPPIRSAHPPAAPDTRGIPHRAVLSTRHQCDDPAE